MCGLSTTCGSALRRAGTRGSSANTSSAAPPSVPRSSASTSAASSTTDPRATLTTMPSGPSARSTSASTRWRVSAPPGVTTTRKSLACASAFSSGSKRYGSCGLALRAVYAIDISNAAARRAIAWPMRPMPTRHVEHLYQIPLNLQAQSMDDIVLDHLKLDLPKADMTEWTEMVQDRKSTRLNSSH